MQSARSEDPAIIKQDCGHAQRSASATLASLSAFSTWADRAVVTHWYTIGDQLSQHRMQSPGHLDNNRSRGDRLL